MNEKEKSILDKANMLIERAVENFKITQKYNEDINGRICGLLEALEILTNKKYVYDDAGVREEKQND